MNLTRFEDSVRTALQREASVIVSPAQLAVARDRLAARVVRDRRARLLGAAAVAAVVLGLMSLILVPGRSSPGPATPVDVVAGARSDPPAPDTDAEPSSLPGAPVPAALRGTWTAPVVSGGQSRRATLTLGATTYQLCQDAVDCLNGSVVRQGSRLVFHDEAWCGAPGDAGAGRYLWSLRGTRLTLYADGPDPCYRAPTLEQAAWRRA